MSRKKIDTSKLISGIFGKEAELTPAAEVPLEPSALFQAKAGAKNPSRRPCCFIPKDFVGLDLGWSSIKAVRVVQDQSGIHLKDVRVIPLNYSQGKPTEEEYQRLTLDALFQLASEYPPKMHAALALNDPVVLTEHLKLPKASYRQLREVAKQVAIERQLVEKGDVVVDAVPFTVEHVFARVGGDALVFAVSEDRVTKQMGFVQSAGFIPFSVETNSTAAFAALAAGQSWHAGERVVLLDVGAQFTTMTVVIENNIVFSRVLMMGGDALTETIAEAESVILSEAERLKRTVGVLKAVADVPRSDASSPSPESVSQLVVAGAGKLVNELKRSLAYLGSKFSDERAEKPDRLLLYGGSSQLPGFSEFLAERLDLKVETPAPWADLFTDEKVFDMEYLQSLKPLVTVSVGLALRVHELTIGIVPYATGIFQKWWESKFKHETH